MVGGKWGHVRVLEQAVRLWEVVCGGSRDAVELGSRGKICEAVVGGKWWCVKGSYRADGGGVGARHADRHLVRDPETQADRRAGRQKGRVRDQAN